MIRYCANCDINTACEDDIEICTRCNHIDSSMKENPCMECLTSLNGCNFEETCIGELLDLDIVQVKENLRVAIRCESEESLKKLLIETLELLEGKENEY